MLQLFSQHAYLIVFFISVQKVSSPCPKMCLPVEVTRTLCRNSFLNKFTSIRPPNKWIATRPGRFNHVSSQGLETDQSLSTCFNFKKFCKQLIGCIPNIFQFQYTTALFEPVKNTPKVWKFATTFFALYLLKSALP